MIVDEFGYSKKTLNIGDWNMDLTTSIPVAHGLSATEWKTIRSINVIIRDDADLEYYPISASRFAANNGFCVDYFDSTDIGLSRELAVDFDGTGYDSTVATDPTFTTRGWVTFEYIPD